MKCCKKCGMIVWYEVHIRNGQCAFCQSKLENVPPKYTAGYKDEESCNDNIREKYIKQSTDYDEELFTAREKLESKIDEKIYENGGAYWKFPELRNNSVSNIPKCPVCHSPSIEKISLGNKVGSVALVGVLAIGHISKTFKCKSCGYKF